MEIIRFFYGISVALAAYNSQRISEHEDNEKESVDVEAFDEATNNRHDNFSQIEELKLKMDQTMETLIQAQERMQKNTEKIQRLMESLENEHNYE